MALFSSGVLLANVAADDTFDTWRVRTNQILTQAAGLTSNNVFSGTLNTFNNAVSIDGPVTAPIVTANTFVGDGSGLTGLSAGLDWSTTTSTAPHYMLISSNTSGTNVDQFNVVSGITIHPGSGRITANTFIGDGSGLTGISAGLTIQDNTSTDASYYPILVSNTSGSGVDQIDVSSTKLYFNPSTGTMNATAFNSLSDETLKKNITKISNATDIVKQLEGIEFDWIDTNQKSSGVIAQSIEKVLPHVVESSDNNLKTVNYSGIISYLIEAVKELSERVSNLENK